MFEKPDDSRDKQWPIYGCKAPSMHLLTEFEEGIVQLIKETEAFISSQPLNLSNQVVSAATPITKKESSGNLAAQPPTAPKSPVTKQSATHPFAEASDACEVAAFTVLALKNVEHKEILKFFEDFNLKVDPVISKSNQEPKKAIELMEEGYDRRYLTMNHDGKIYGLLACHYD